MYAGKRGILCVCVFTSFIIHHQIAMGKVLFEQCFPALALLGDFQKGTRLFTTPEAGGNVDQRFLTVSGSDIGLYSSQMDFKVFVRYEKPERGKQTVFILGGLTDYSDKWNDYSKELIDRGYGVIRIDLIGQGRTLLHSGLFKGAVYYQSQVELAHKALEELAVEEPVNLVGLSYGGSIAIAFAAKYPSLIKKLIIHGPGVEPIALQDKFLQSMVNWTNFYGSLIGVSYNEDTLYNAYLENWIKSTYGLAYPDPLLSDPLFIPAAANNVIGWRQLCNIYRDLLKDVPQKSLYLVRGTKDEYVGPEVAEHVWDGTPAGLRGSRFEVNGMVHDFNKDYPNRMAELAIRILEGDIPTDTQFNIDPDSGRVVSSDGKGIEFTLEHISKRAIP